MAFELTRVLITKEEELAGVIECFVEDRGPEWSICYIVFEDKVEVTESMGDVYDHCFKVCENLDEAISVASQWC